MVRFYDANDEAEFSNVVALLNEHGIEFTVTPEPQPGIGRKEILIAEEDFPFADELLRQALQVLRH
jgi:hypothetical protein